MDRLIENRSQPIVALAMMASLLTGCHRLESWDVDSRTRLWEKNFLEGARSQQRKLYNEAIDAFNRALVEARGLENDDIRLAFTYEQLGSVFLTLANYSEAQTNFEHALQIYEQCRAKSNLSARTLLLVDDGIAGSSTALGQIALARRQFSGAETPLLRAAAIYKQTADATTYSAGTNLQSLLLCQSALADAYLADGKLDQAETMYQKVLKEIPYCVSSKLIKDKAVENYAKVLRLKGQNRESAAMARMARENDTDRTQLDRLLAEANNLIFARNFVNAEKMISDALTRSEKFGKQSREMHLALRAEADLFYELGRVDAARSAAEEALAIKQMEIGAEDVEVERDLHLLIKISILQENWNTAKELLVRQHRMQTASTNPRMQQMAENRAQMAYVAEKLGDKKAAELCIASALNFAEQSKKKARVANSLAILASVFNERGDDARAQELFQKALDTFKDAAADRRMIEPKILLVAGNFFSKLGDMKRAEACYYKALGFLTNKNDPLVATILAHYALLELKAGNIERARKLANQAGESMPRYPDAIHRDYDETMTSFNNAERAIK